MSFQLYVTLFQGSFSVASHNVHYDEREKGDYPYFWGKILFFKFSEENCISLFSFPILIIIFKLKWTVFLVYIMILI